MKSDKKSRVSEVEMDMDETLEPVSDSTVKTPPSYEERLLFLNPIAKPLAGRKLTKKIYKLIKKARKQPPSFFSGLKSVQQKLRKGGDGNHLPVHQRKVFTALRAPFASASPNKPRGSASIRIPLTDSTGLLVILAGDVNPIDVYSHLPGVCEEKNLPYCFVPSREDIGLAMGTRRGVIAVFIVSHPDYADTYDEVLSEVKALPLPF